MFNTLRQLFSGKQQPQPSKSVQADSQEKLIFEYFSEELDNSAYFKPESKQTVLNHLLHVLSITKTGNNLSVEEKKALGLNTRLAITKELIEVLSAEGLRLENPKAALEEIYNRATITKTRIDNFEKARRIGITKFTLMTAGDGSECSWCRKNSDREFGVDILSLMKSNCTCSPYAKCIINSVIAF